MKSKYKNEWVDLAHERWSISYNVNKLPIVITQMWIILHDHIPLFLMHCRVHQIFACCSASNTTLFTLNWNMHCTWYMYIQPHTIFNDGMTCACRCNLHSQNSHKSSVSKNSTHMIFVMFIFYASILLPTRRISHTQFKATQIICGIPMKAANILGKKSLVKLKCNRV